jgi:hypothetical protein
MNIERASLLDSLRFTSNWLPATLPKTIAGDGGVEMRHPNRCTALYDGATVIKENEQAGY